MTVTIGLVANVYNEANALPGWLETHTPAFDDVRVLHAGPQGEYSTDGTIELLERWRVPVTFTSIDEGFGEVRTRALRMSPCDWVVLLDADERLYPVHRTLSCPGQPTSHSEVDRILGGYTGPSPDWGEITKLGDGLTVSTGEAYDAMAVLRELVSGPSYDAVAAVRRHWHDFTFRRPTQSWVHDPDLQLRIVRNHEDIRFDPSTRMHERLCGAKNVVRADSVYGPFFDHFHFAFKRMEMAQRCHDVAVYDAIHHGRKPPTGAEFTG